MVRQRAHGRTCDWGGGGTWHWAAGHRHCLHCHLLSLRKAIDDVFLIPKQEGQINKRRSKWKVYHDDGLLVNDGLLLLLSQNSVLGFWRREKDTVNRADWQKSCWMRFLLSLVSFHAWYEPGVTGATAATGGDITPPTGRTLTAVNTETHTSAFCHILTMCVLLHMLMMYGVTDVFPVRGCVDVQWQNLPDSAPYLFYMVMWRC